MNENWKRNCYEHNLPLVNQGGGLWSCPVEGCHDHAHDDTAKGFEMALCPICYKVYDRGETPRSPEAKAEHQQKYEAHMARHGRLRKFWFMVSGM